MRKTKATTKARSRQPVRAKTTSAEKKPRPGSHLEKIGEMLARKNGCTAKDVLEATRWPSVSMPQQAKALGITLHKHKGEDGITRYADHALSA